MPTIDKFSGVQFTHLWVGEDPHEIPEGEQPKLLCHPDGPGPLVLALEGAPLRIDSTHGLHLGETPFLRMAGDQVGLQAPGGLSIQTGSPPSPALTISSDGSVGIGKTAHIGQLEVQGGVKAQELELNGAVKATEFLKHGVPLTSSQWDSVTGGINYAGGNVGIGTAAPTHKLHVNDNMGIRQNCLYLGGKEGWSSLSFNAYHDLENNNWVFPDKARPAVTLEMDDSNGVPRFQVWSTMSGDTQGWRQLLMIDGNSGNVVMGQSGGSVGIGTTDPAYKLDVADRMRVREGVSSAGIWFFQTRPANDQAFVGMVDDNHVGFWGNPTGWGLSMDINNGTVTKRGGAFKIDHPLDPANKYLQHSFVESPDMMNIYNGNVRLDESGTATVVLPGWFEALNRDFRYQLTCIGEYAPVYIAEGVAEGRFVIAGGKPGGDVSWLVTGIRKDPWAVDHTIQVEVEKSESEQGTYLYPDGYEKRNGQRCERSAGVLIER